MSPRSASSLAAFAALAATGLAACQLLTGSGVVSGRLVDAGVDGGSGGAGGSGTGGAKEGYACSWARDIAGDVDPDLAMIVDATGAVVVTGSFRGSLDFGAGPLVAGDPSSSDVFVAKLGGTMGQPVWSRAFGDDGNDQGGRALAVDGTTLYLAGTYRGSLSPPGSCAALPPETLPMVTDDDVFLLKLTAEGECLTGAHFGFPGSVESAAGVAVSAGQVLLLAAAHDEGEMHLLRYDGSLATPASCSFTDPTGEMPSTLRLHPRALVAAGQGALVAGGFEGTMKPCVGGASMAENKSVAGSEDVFVGGLAPENLGGLLDPSRWTSTFGDQGNQRVQALATDGQTFLYATGSLDGSLSIGDAVLNASPGGKDAFIAQLHLDGSPGWAFRYGDFADQSGEAVAADPATQSVFLAGNFKGTITLGGDSLPDTGFAGAIYLARLRASDGSPLWSRSFGDGASAGQAIKALGVSPVDGGLILAGTYTGTLDFGPGCSPLTSADPTHRHLFVAKLLPAAEP